MWKESLYQFTEKPEGDNDFQLNLLNNFDETPNKTPQKLIEREKKSNTNEDS